jgi:DNA-binding SARP family transcriptional activator
MARLQLRLFGGFDLQAGPGQAVPTKLKKAQALLAYLACHPGQSHPRDKLATLLWPEIDDRQARANLRKVLYVLRSRLSLASPSLRLDEDTVTLDTAALDVDVLAFQRLARRADPEALQQAVDLYRGDLLEGLGVTEVPFEEWLKAERERLRELGLEALAKLLAHQTKSEEADAVTTALRLLALDPLQEAVHRALMRLYVRDGRRDAALRQYQSCVETLRRELGVEPEAETRELYQEVLRSRATASKATRTAMAHLDVLASQVRHPPSPLPDEAPMFGRQSELTRLRHALDEALASRGQLIAVLGEAGIGKSRLVSQVTVEAVKRGALALVSHGYQTEQTLAYGVWIDALRRGGVLDRDDVLSGVAPAWRAELARLFPELAHRDARPASSPEDATRLFEAVGHLLERLAKTQPLLLVLEDVHWADEASIRLTSVLSRRIASWPILIVLTAREEDVAEAPVLRDLLRLPKISRLPLGPLSQEDTTALVQSLAPRGRVVDAEGALAERIWGASNGNPFVVVEILRALEQGALPTTTADALALPDRVRELVMVRLERLSEAGQALVALAAVIGREFEFELLQRASGLEAHEAADGVEELVRRQMLRTVGDRFKVVHDWVREVVYGALLPMRRKLLHRDVADALETLYTSDLEPHLTALGLHYHGGEAWEKAVTFLQRAGVQAMTRSANREAVDLFEQTIDALGHLPQNRTTLEQAVDLRLNLRVALIALGQLDKLRAYLAEAERLARDLADRRRLGWVSVYLGQYFWLIAQAAESRACSQEALEAARAVDDARLEILANMYLGYLARTSGEYRLAADFCRTMMKLTEGALQGERIGPSYPAAIARQALSYTLADRGEFAEGIALGQEGIRLAESLAQPFTTAQCYWGLGYLYGIKGDLAEAARLLGKGTALCREWDVGFMSPVLAWTLGWVYALSARVDEGLALMGAGLAGIERLGFRVYEALGHVQLAEALSIGYRLDEAGRAATRALELARARGQRAFEAGALRMLGEVSARRDPSDADAAEDHYLRAMALAEELGMRPLEAHCHLGLGNLHRRTRKADPACEHLATAMAMYREMDMRFWLGQMEAA